MHKNSKAPAIQEFSEHFFSNLQEKLLEAKHHNAKNGRPAVAAFDADGTLWDTDMGEKFFEYQIEHCGLDGVGPDAFKKYLDMKQEDILKAYVWLAAINKGKSIDQVREWSHQALLKHSPAPLFNSKQRLIEFLHKNDFEVYVVTASIKWAVEAPATLYDIKKENVLGVETKVVNGIVTDEPVFPITYRQGKAEALLKATKGVAPILASGNTTGDTHLLESASHLKLAVSTQTEPNELYHSEQALQKIAHEKSWLRHHYKK